MQDHSSCLPQFSTERSLAELRSQAAGLYKLSEAMPARLRGSRFVFAAVVRPECLELGVPDGFFRATHLETVGGLGVIVAGGPSRCFLVAANKQSFERIGEILESPVGTVAEQASWFDGFRMLSPQEVTSPADQQLLTDDRDQLISLEAVLHPAISERGDRTSSERNLMIGRWGRFVRELGGERDGDVRQVGELTFVPVRLPAKAVRVAVCFNPLRSLNSRTETVGKPVYRTSQPDLVAA